MTATWGETDAATTSAVAALLAKRLDRAAVVRIAILKVRKQLAGDSDPGWYEHPAGTVAGEASA